MTRMTDARDFDQVHDLDRLGLVVDELRAVHAMLSQFSNLAAEMPGVELERAAGIGASAALVARRIRQAETRLEQVQGQEAAGVVVVDPERAPWLQGRDDRHLLPVVAAPWIGGLRGISSGIWRLAAGASAVCQVHSNTDVIAVMLFGSALVTWWDANGTARQAPCRRHQHLHIPRGVPYVVSNAGPVPMLAVVACSATDLAGDVELRPDLERELRSLPHEAEEMGAAAGS